MLLVSWFRLLLSSMGITCASLHMDKPVREKPTLWKVKVRTKD